MRQKARKRQQGNQEKQVIKCNAMQRHTLSFSHLIRFPISKPHKSAIQASFTSLHRSCIQKLLHFVLWLGMVSFFIKFQHCFSEMFVALLLVSLICFSEMFVALLLVSLICFSEMLPKTHAPGHSQAKATRATAFESQHSPPV